MNPTVDGWYAIWFLDKLESEGRYLCKGYYFADLKQWSKCGERNKCVIRPDGWMEYGNLS